MMRFFSQRKNQGERQNSNLGIGGLRISTITDETHAVSKKILARLIVQPTRQHEACEYAVKDSVSMKKAISVFYWLRNCGFIQKVDRKYCSPFTVTEKGKLFFEVLSYDTEKIV